MTVMYGTQQGSSARSSTSCDRTPRVGPWDEARYFFLGPEQTGSTVEEARIRLVSSSSHAVAVILRLFGIDIFARLA